MPLFDENSPTQYDAIVIGTGISGGWAAKELCEKGLKTLVLERGRNIIHVTDYHTANLDPWDLENRGKLSEATLAKDYPKQRRTGYTVRPEWVHHFVKDSEHPYEEKENTRFDWIRGYQVGGRSLVWGRQSYRLSPMDFEANAKEGIAVDWPIRYDQIAPWYDYVESFIGVSGRNEGFEQLPDGKFLAPMDLNCVESDLQKQMEQRWQHRKLTIGRTAHITSNSEKFGDRGSCQYRKKCMAGCPYGAYFSSNSSTLPAAENTGNMTLRPNSIAYEILYDEVNKKASGVMIIDAKTKKTYEFNAKIIFVNASAIHSAKILMQSKSNRFPNGMGNDSGELGHNIMDHHFEVGASGNANGFEDRYYKGRRPNGFYIPRFRNLPKHTATQRDYLRGFGYQGGASRQNWMRAVAEMGYGGDFKDNLFKPGSWRIGINGFGEMLPYHDNKMVLLGKKDEWGLPLIEFNACLHENELKMRIDMKNCAGEILEAAGFKNVQYWEGAYGVGLAAHEMGTARMGRNPQTSILNQWNQIHAVPNVFLTDGACMTSSACQNPSLTYMALTARAANFAVEQIKKRNL